MEYSLIISSNGVMFAGERLDNNPGSEWTGIKPSKKSDVCIFFKKDQIHTVYHENGSREEFITDNYNSQYSHKTCIPDQDTVLIRVKGGVSYRGQLYDEPIEEMGEGYWITPVIDQRIRIYIPQEEAEEIFVL
jgi:hypothetical protein